MVNVIVTVYKDATGVCENGYVRAVSSESTVYSVERTYMSNTPGYCSSELPAYRELLKISEPNLGVLWIDETPTSFAILIGQAQGASAVGVDSTTFTVVTASQTQVIPATIGASAILGISVNGIQVYVPNYSFTSSTGTFVFDATNVPISATDTIGVIFKTP